MHPLGAQGGARGGPGDGRGRRRDRPGRPRGRPDDDGRDAGDRGRAGRSGAAGGVAVSPRSSATRATTATRRWSRWPTSGFAATCRSRIAGDAAGRASRWRARLCMATGVGIRGARRETLAATARRTAGAPERPSLRDEGHASGVSARAYQHPEAPSGAGLRLQSGLPHAQGDGGRDATQPPEPRRGARRGLDRRAERPLAACSAYQGRHFARVSGSGPDWAYDVAPSTWTGRAYAEAIPPRAASGWAPRRPWRRTGQRRRGAAGRPPWNFYRRAFVRTLELDFNQL